MRADGELLTCRSGQRTGFLPGQTALACNGTGTSTRSPVVIDKGVIHLFKDPCAWRALWSPITAAGLESTVAGVLAGLLIAAAAALLVQWYQGSDAHTIALFGSGVPALALSTYLFTVIAGVDYPNPEHYADKDYPNQLKFDYMTPGSTGDNLCSQLWSGWVLAIGSLFIGTAVLICGLAWALVSYADNLAVKLLERNDPIEWVGRRRRFFIRLNAWLSSAVITAALALLISVNVAYLAAIGQQDFHKGYLLFFVYFFGLYFLGHSAFVVFIRTQSAIRADKESCAAYAAGGPPVATDNEGIKAGVGPVRPPAAKDRSSARRKKVAIRAAQEFGVAMWVALAALLAVYMTSGKAFNQPRSGIAVSPKIVIYVVVLYIIVRASYIVTYPVIVSIAKRVTARWVTARKDDTSTNQEAVPPANAKSVDRIRISYSYGMLTPTTYGVVLLAILETLFVVAFSQGPLWTGPRIFLSLFLGGLYPAVLLAWLSSSVPAAEGAR